MPKIYSYTAVLETDIVDAFCLLQKGFTDQFVYYDKSHPTRFLGLGRCIAISSIDDADSVLQGPIEREPIYFSFQRFDADAPKPTDDMMAAFPRLALMLPELVLMQTTEGSFLQVNSLGPVYEGRVARFVRHAHKAQTRTHRSISHVIKPDSREAWQRTFNVGMRAIEEGRIEKLVPSRRVRLVADEPFSSKDLLVNLIDGPAAGTVFLYRYGDVFFCGCTPELLVRKSGTSVSSMCLAGTIARGAVPEEDEHLAADLIADDKNRREHEYVVHFMREVFARNCFNVRIPAEPRIMKLDHVQHLFTPVAARVMGGRTLLSLVSQLHPTPALSGTPVGEALMCLRDAEPYNRGFFGGTVGYVDGAGTGEFSVAIRSGVFDGETGWLYAGCGIVAGSDMQSEFDEISLKLKTILSAFEAPVANMEEDAQ